MAKAKQTPKRTIQAHVKKTKRQTALAFVPKKENQYRPHLIRRYGLLLIISVAIALQFGYNFTKTGSVLGRVVTITPNALLVATNDKRTEAGVKPLRMDDRLSHAAMLKANDIIQNQYWNHVSPAGVEPWQWIQQAHYSYDEAGENLARDFSTASGTVAGWMASESHKDNMLKSSYTDIGLAVTTGELDGAPTTIIVALYAKPTQNSIITSYSPYTASAAPVHNSSQPQKLSLAARIGIAIQSLTPAAITSIALIFIAITVATTAQVYRHRLPKKLQKTWYKDHGMIKASGLFAIAAFIVLLYGGGQL